MNSDDFVVGSVWQSPYSMYVWLVLTSEQQRAGEPPHSLTIREGTCLILGQDEQRMNSFAIGSVVLWRSSLQWCRSSMRIL